MSGLVPGGLKNKKKLILPLFSGMQGLFSVFPIFSIYSRASPHLMHGLLPPQDSALQYM